MKTLLKGFSVILSLAVSTVNVSAQEQRIRVGFSAMSGSMAWLWTAKEGGYFEQHGLKADLVYVGGTAQLFQAMLAGEIAFGIGGGGSSFGGGSMVERNLDRATVFFAILFVVNTIVLLKV